MAISGGDGSIILTTKVDTKGLDAAMAKMRQQAKGTGSAFESLSNFIKIQETRLAALRQQYASYVLKNEEGSVAAKKLASDIKNLSTSLTQNQARLNAASASAASFGAKAKTAIAGVGASLKVLASYLIGIQTIFAAINFSKQAGEFATQTEASVQRLIDIYGEAAQSVGDFIDANARAIGMSKSSASSFASVYGNLFSVWADQSTNAELTNRYLNMTAVVASKTGRTVQDVQERIRSGLLGNTEAIEDLGVFVNVKTIEMTDAFQRMAYGRSWEQLDAYTQQQVRTMAILEQATAKYGNTVADTTATIRAQYQAAYEDFQNTWGQVVNTVLIPVLKVLTQVFIIATKGLQILAGLSGKTVDNFNQEEEDADKTRKNIEKQRKEQEKLNKSVKKGLASFDEINTLTEQSAENTEDLGGNNGGGGNGANYNNSFVDQIDADLAAIMGYVGFALAAIGIILICFGHIGWGIGFLIAGAAIFSVSQAALSEGEELEKVKNIMNGVIAGISWLVLVLGIILVCTGVGIPFGIGLIIVGAAGLATEVALNWNAIKTTVVNVFNAVFDWIKTWGLLVLGIILTLTGKPFLGLPLIALGAKSLTEAQNPTWLAILDKLKEVWGKIRAFWDSYIAPIFTAKWWADLGKKAINGLLGVIESGLNWIIGKINDFIGGLSKIVGAVGDVIGVDWNIPKIPRVSIPRLAQGAVIPPNREFLAVLGDQKHGTNIEAPLDTIVEAFNIALSKNGTSQDNRPIILQIDGREIARATREGNASLGSQTVFGGFANAY